MLDGCCHAIEAAFRQCTQKPVHVYKDAETLKAVLQQVYGRDYSAVRYQKAQTAFAALNGLLQQLEQSALSGNDFGTLAFYSRFIFELDLRIAFLARVCDLVAAASGEPPRIPVSVHCPDGIIHKIAPTAGRYFKPVRALHETADVACAGCIYPAGQYVGY